jgi:hypothetical protein
VERIAAEGLAPETERVRWKGRAARKTAPAGDVAARIAALKIPD